MSNDDRTSDMEERAKKYGAGAGFRKTKTGDTERKEDPRKNPIDPYSATAPEVPDLSLDKDVSYSLQYRIPKKLSKLFYSDPKKLSTLSSWFFNQIRGQDDDRREYMEDRLPKFRLNVLNFVTAGLQEIYEGSHNVHIPVAFEKCKAMHARIYQAIFGIEPIFVLKPRMEVSQSAKDAKEQLLQFMIKTYANNRAGIYSVIDRDIWNFVSDGTAVTRHYWKKDARKFTDTEEVINAEGEPEEKEVERESVVFDGPMMSTVELEDFYMVGDKWDSADSLDLIAERNRYTKSDVVKLSRQGFFVEETVNKLLSTTEPTIEDLSFLTSETANKNEKQFETGIRQYTKESGPKGYTIFEGYFRYDIDGDGVDEELVGWFELRSRLCLRLTYLERVGPGGKRPYVIKRFFPRSATPYGIGLGEMLYGINSEVDYLHNLRLDSAVFQVLPFFFYRASSAVNEQKKTMRIKPGQGIRMDDPNNDINFPRVNGNVSYPFQEEQNIMKTASGVSSISDISTGQIGGQGATRTATGTAALVAAGDALIDISIKRYQQGFAQNLQIIDKQVVDLLPRGTLIRVTGIDGKELLKVFNDRKAFLFDVDFELQANSANSNKAIERELAATVFQNSLNPVLIQTGVVGPEQIKNSYVRYLKSLETPSVEKYVANYQDQIFPYRSGKDELTMILMGVKPEVILNDKHAEKLAFFQEFENSPDFSLFSDPQQQQLYLQTKQAHQGAMDAIAAQAASQAAAGFTAPMQTAGVAAGAGNPGGMPAQQQSDLSGSGFGPQ